MMAQVKGIYASGTESRKKKTTATGVQAQPVVTATPVQKPVKPATVTVPAQTVNAARQERIRDQRYESAERAGGSRCLRLVEAPNSAGDGRGTKPDMVCR